MVIDKQVYLQKLEGENGWMVLLKFKSRTQSIFKQFYALFMFSQD